MAATRGRVVRTPTKDKPYKIVLEHDGSADTEVSVNSMREGEAMIRKQLPARPERNRSRDRPSTIA